jgi:hypothetical protein
MVTVGVRKAVCVEECDGGVSGGRGRGHAPLWAVARRLGATPGFTGPALSPGHAEGVWALGGLGGIFI